MTKLFVILIILAIERSRAYTYIDPRVGESGQCSWYEGYDNAGSYKPNGISTSSGEVFSRWSYTAAHKTLPFGTLIKIRNEVNNLTVIVRINDRGPFYRGRIVDMTRRAWGELDTPQELIEIPCVYELLEAPPTIYRYGPNENNTGTNRREIEQAERAVRKINRVTPIKLRKIPSNK